MSEPNPPRRPLATFLRTASAGEAAPATDARMQDDAAPAAPTVEPAADPIEPMQPPAAERRHDDDTFIVEDVAPLEPAPVAVPAAVAAASDAPSFLGSARARTLPAPRWHWLLVAGLALLLVLQSVLADRARLAADAGNRAWLAPLCGVLHCSLPPWHEPAAFTMTSREIRPLPGQAGVLQVQASIRNDARWAQAWPDLRLSLSDADGRVIGSGVFPPAQYLGEPPGTAQLEPGQSARIAFRVQEPAASTVAFTFDFL
ncbi:DUF3426 domain-containing protein [Stenotrophomonas maltophilia]|uniref:DUF3426 domain-containing protein n=1 Tax=Stenotrophomonas maltophilia TaxID=40324 RepID=UPI0006AA4102|nr:DUF3426 domain-containing protein [Stenotrophomonas maltophilia]ALA84102.1 membrane protein [Stenotrophomonas maltophilia]MBH1477187.1 DUF3426 domain-containing protein [Stenotrophomonas maltophilia]MBH1502444.1 DUF3426 domain-containing protein [Stenotrophomonas maltophilia]MBH1784991.1 DUF3426 domain-containing protein [Stenotrophomonas maltophilia]